MLCKSGLTITEKLETYMTSQEESGIVTSKSEDKAIVLLFEMKPLLSLRETKKIVFKKKYTLNKECHWAQENINSDYSNVILTDESTFVLFYLLRRVNIYSKES
nr:uncharacterized protein LOC118682821 [Bactrocera oleae]